MQLQAGWEGFGNFLMDVNRTGRPTHQVFIRHRSGLFLIPGRALGPISSRNRRHVIAILRVSLAGAGMGARIPGEVEGKDEVEVRDAVRTWTWMWMWMMDDWGGEECDWGVLGRARLEKSDGG